MKSTYKTLLFNTDGVDSASGNVPPPAPLDTSADLMNYDNTTVLIDPGTYPMQCVETELKPNAAGTVVITLANIDRVRSVKGDVVEPGDGRVFAIVNTALTGKMKQKMLNDSLSFVIQAFAKPGVTSIDGMKQNHGLLKGEQCLVQLVTEPAGVGKDGKHRDARTSVAKWYKKGTMPTQ